MNRTFATVIALFIVCVFGLGAVAIFQLKVEPDKQNVVASRLIGTWIPDAPLTKRLGGTSVHEFAELDDSAITFTEQPNIIDTLPPKFNEFFTDHQIFLAGIMTLGENAYPFVLISHKGNPHVVIFMPNDGGPTGNAESCNVMLPAAKDHAHDLLFIGGDMNNQPFSAYKRAEEKE